MPFYCCVPLCTSQGGHKFPRDPTMRWRWQLAIKRLDPTSNKVWSPTKSSVVCSRHFNPDDYVDTLLGERKRLKKTAVPHLVAGPCEATDRQSRYLERQLKGKSSQEMIASSSTHGADLIVGEVQEVLTSLPEDTAAELDVKQVDVVPDTVSMGIQVGHLSTERCMLSLSRIQNNPRAVKYYTGFESAEHLMFFYHILGSAAHYIALPASLSPENQLLLTLMKLRQAKDNYELSILFGISASTVSNIFTTWIRFMYYQLEELDIWPTREVITSFMPQSFGRQFPSTRVILDATEIPIKKPGQVEPQRQTFSTYKNKNTLKVVVGCTPRGVVSYVSDAYGGSASDRQIIERSDLCLSQSRFEKGDSIMADRGIMVQDLFATRDVKVNTPTMLKGKSQLDPATVVRDRRVASKRIHVERVIGLAKTYKILQRELPSAYLTLGHMIISVCFKIVNFRESVVKRTA